MKFPVLAVLLWTPLALAGPQQIDEYRWTGVDRIVAIGDLHGDFDNYLATLEAAGLVDRHGRWSGGVTHLVQTGDIPDRRPDTAKIMEHIDRLAMDARRKGGAVHRLLGNHEAMNFYGDLRYVSAGEYQAFVTRNSDRLRDRYFELVLKDIEQRDPEGFASLPENFREQWNLEHPPGWVEHRQAWDPRWNPDGEFAQRTLELKVAVQINDLVFVHGGISGRYCRNSLASLTDLVIARLRNLNPADLGPLEDELGPLWYRGLSGEAPEALPETVAAILDRHGAKHIVVGHTPTGGAVWPRYDGRVIQIDTGISAAYGGNPGYLEVNSEGLFAGYPGGKVPLPASDGERIAYLERVIALDPDNAQLRRRLEQLVAPVAVAEQEPVPGGPSSMEAPVAGDEEDPAAEQADTGTEPVAVPICGIYE